MGIQEQPGNILLLSLAWSHCQHNQLGTVIMGIFAGSRFDTVFSFIAVAQGARCSWESELAIA